MRKTITRGKGERGQAFMELAISIVFLLVLLAAVIDLGWAFYEMIALRDAAQEAASFGSMCPPATSVEEDKILERLALSATAPIDMADVTSSVEMVDPLTNTPVTTVTLGNSVRVSATINHHILTPMVGTFIGTYEYPLTVTVSSTIMREDCRE
jgi:Flp pilus assembly protein TadG